MIRAHLFKFVLVGGIASTQVGCAASTACHISGFGIRDPLASISHSMQCNELEHAEEQQALASARYVRDQLEINRLRAELANRDARARLAAASASTTPAQSPGQ